MAQGGGESLLLHGQVFFSDFAGAGAGAGGLLVSGANDALRSCPTIRT